MADLKISALTASTTPLAGTEVLPIVQSSTTKQVSVANLTAGRSVTATNFIPSGSTIPTNGVYLPAANAVGIATNSTNSVYINSSQNVGIGTSSPTAGSKVMVQGALLAAGIATALDTTNLGVQIGGGGTVIAGGASTVAGIYADINGFGGASDLIIRPRSDGSAGALRIYTGTGGGTERMRVSNAGIVTMSAYGAGAATFSAAGVISSVSDENWKIKDGVPLNPAEMLKKLEPGYWYYNDKYKDTYGVDRQLGFYAQNVNAAIGPEAAPEPESNTTTDENGNEIIQQKPWGYYDRSVLAVVVMTLKDALKSIETLEARISSLEAKND